MPATACATLTYTCGAGPATAVVISDPLVERPAGDDAQATAGDYLLQNDFIRAVVEAPDSIHAHYVAPTGGTLIDLAVRAGGGDHLNQASTVTGILPRDAAAYQTVDRVSGAPGCAAVVARGHLVEDTRVLAVTRYEVCACDPGVRIRTELYNGGRNLGGYFLADALFWGDREVTPFVPARGIGFRQPPLDLLEIDLSWRRFPWVAAQAHAPPYASYAVVPCDRQQLDGVNDVTLSAVGTPRSLVAPGDGIAFERMILVAGTMGLSGAQALALDARERMFGEPAARATGRTVTTAGTPIGGDERLASLFFYEPGASLPDAPDEILPWAEVVPDSTGAFTVSLPANRSYRVQAYRLGRPVGAPAAFELADSSVPPLALGDIVLPPPAVLTVNVTDAATGGPVMAEVILVPAGPTLAADVDGSVYGDFHYDSCAPYLGPPNGGSPACNRALLETGTMDIAVPPGTYWVYATLGPQATIARQQVTLAEGATATADLAVERLAGIFPAGSLNGDFHVHGGSSFDTSFPDRERALSFATSGVDVIAATDHNTCSSYADAILELGIQDRVVVMPGVESTGLIPYLYRPGSSFPKTVGHFNFWPLVYDPTQPRNGALWDELSQPGELFDAYDPVINPLGVLHGVMEMNHPWAESKIGRDEGYLTMLGFDPRVELPMRDDGSAMGMLFAAPGGNRRNIDFDVMEVMNGSRIIQFLRYRAIWASLLNQGIIRGGTANSDSHSLAIENLGYSRNVVLGSFSLAAFDADGFNGAIRAGNIVGTNGPFIEATLVDDATGLNRGPSTAPFAPRAGGSLAVEVRAAPWIPVTEIRIVVNGQIVHTVSGAAIAVPADPFGATGIVRFTGSFPLADLLGPSGRDAWIVVEAGLPLPEAFDLDFDGIVDVLDANGDGVADASDAAEPEPELLPPPADTEPRFHLHVVSPNSYPAAFTNPFLLDVDGGGWTEPGLPAL